VPKPHKVTAVDIDLRVGGRFNTTFDVEGNVMQNNGVYLEVVPGEKLVFTDAYTEGWKPAPEPFMTAILILSTRRGGARPTPPLPGTGTPIPARRMRTWVSSTAGARW
jgi:uncharacterized protein YndB with AHSA1/START domain